MLPFLSRNRKAPIFAFFKNLAFRLQNHRFSQQSRSSGPQNPQFCPASRTPITTPQAVLRLVQSPSSPQGRAPRVSSRACTRRPPLSLPGPPQAHPHSYSPRPPKGNIVTVTKWRDHTCYFRSSWHLGSTHRPSPSVSLSPRPHPPSSPPQTKMKKNRRNVLVV